MTLRDQELEGRIEEVGNKLTSPPSDVQQLLLLLDKAENLLSRVEQCPPQSMHVALGPSMKALVTRDLLRHSDLDVKIAIASCLSEITRITAPDAPYDDDLMKEIFGLIVGAFKNLDEMSSRSFSKRVSILETVAKVRSCVLMLDLECDDLILDMFHHFLKTIRSKHSDTVFSSMETVMSLVIEESENISAKLLSCLLDNLKIDEKNILSSAKKLSEKVLANCALKLKPYLVETFKSNCAPLSDYSKVVATLCQENLGTSMQKEMNAVGEVQADDSKFSDRTPCDELPQGSAKQEHEVLGKAVADVDEPSKLATSNGIFQMGNGDSIASEQKSEFSQSGVQLRDISGSGLDDSDKLGSGTGKLDSGLNLSSRKGKKRKNLVKLVVNNNHKQIDDEKESPIVTGRRKGRTKEADLSQVDGLSLKEVETAACPKPGKKSKLESTPGLADVSSSVSLHTPNEHDVIHSRKGRTLRSKKTSGKRIATDKAAVDGSSSASAHGGLLESCQVAGGDFLSRELSSKKSEVISESEKNLSKFSASKTNTRIEDSKTTPTATDSKTKRQRQRGRSGSQKQVKEVDSLGQKQIAGTKQQKGGVLHVDEEDKEVKLKELVSSRKLTMKESIKDQSLLKDINESKSGRKRARATQETIGTPKRRKSNEKLIGSKIRVWWPEDESFYTGVVDSFDRSTKKHKILYDDGDVEVLLLKTEIWEFIEAESRAVGENNTPDISASDVSNKKSKGRRGRSKAASDKTKTDLPMNSPDSPIKTESNDKLPKRKGTLPVEILGDETPKKSNKGRRKSGNRHPDKSHKDNNQITKSANKLDSEKLAESTKPDPSKSADKVESYKSKSGDKVGTDTIKIRRKLKGDSSRSRVKSKEADPKSRKKSLDAHGSGVKSMDENSPRTKSSTEGRQKPGGRRAKGSSRKARGGSTPRSRNLNATDTPKSDQPKIEESEARSTTGKKRKRGRLGR